MELPECLIKSSLESGDILHADIFADIDHGKFFVVLGILENIVGIFMINSNINPFIWRRKEMLEMQFPMKPSDYTFLSHQSFLDASCVKFIDADALSTHLNSGRCKKVGKLKLEDMAMLFAAAQKSPLFTDEIKKNFLKLIYTSDKN